MLENFKKKLLFLKDCKFIFSLPIRNKKFLLYDSNKLAKDFMKILQINDISYLHIREDEEINIPIIFITLFKNGFNKFFFNYKLNYIKFSNSKIIITICDNDENFYKFKFFFKSLIFISIQNGYRTGENRDVFYRIQEKKIPKEKLWVDKIFCFGPDVKNVYKKFIEADVQVAGSIRNNFIKKVNILNYKKEITYLSIFKKNSHRYSTITNKNNEKFIQYRQYHKVDKIILKFLESYCKNNNFHLNILARSFNNNEDLKIEKLKYKKILKNYDYTFIEKKEELYGYNFINKHKSYIVNQDSTLGYELLSRLHRVAFFSIRGNVLNTHGFNFGWPSRFEDVGKFWTNIHDVRIFKKIMDYVINCSNKEWNLEANTVSSQIIKYDYNNSIIRTALNKY